MSHPYKNRTQAVKISPKIEFKLVTIFKCIIGAIEDFESLFIMMQKLSEESEGE